MAKLGTKKRPAIVRVQTEARAKEVASIFAEHGWQFILGIEPGKPEDISDLRNRPKITFTNFLFYSTLCHFFEGISYSSIRHGI